MANDPELIRTYNGYTLERDVAGSDPGDPYSWYWIITSPKQRELPEALKGYWIELTNLLSAIRPGRYYRYDPSVGQGILLQNDDLLLLQDGSEFLLQ